jgi:hypothetical protein
MTKPINLLPLLSRSADHGRPPLDTAGDRMRKPRPNSYNPAQALHLIASDRNGDPLSCPSCSGSIQREPGHAPPPPRSHVTLKCVGCGRVARYIAGAA